METVIEVCPGADEGPGQPGLFPIHRPSPGRSREVQVPPPAGPDGEQACQLGNRVRPTAEHREPDSRSEVAEPAEEVKHVAELTLAERQGVQPARVDDDMRGAAVHDRPQGRCVNHLFTPLTRISIRCHDRCQPFEGG